MNKLVCLFGSTGGISTAIRDKFIEENQKLELISRNQIANNISTLEQSIELSKATDNNKNSSSAEGLTVDAIFLSHAPQKGKSGKEYLSENLDLLKRSLDYLEESNLSQYIFASSSAVYGTSRDLPLQETTPPEPENIYGELKLLSEQFLLHEFKEIPEKLTILRIFNVFGPGMNNSFINKIHDSLPQQEITFLGTSNFKRDYVEVSDVAEAMYLATKFSRNGEKILNIASGNPITNAELSQWVSKNMDNKIQTLTCDNSYSTADTTLANRAIHFRFRRTVWDYLKKNQT